MPISEIMPWTARSLLFVPGDSSRKLEKALASDADLLILDLEDSIAEGAKAEARIHVAQALAAPRSTPLWVRINALDTPHALQDLVTVVAQRPDGVMLPKATPDEIARLHHYLMALEAAWSIPYLSIRVIAIASETAPAFFRLGDFGGAPRLDALTWGAEDFATELGADSNRDDNGEFLAPFQMARTLCLAGAVAARAAPIETVDPNFRDTGRLRRAAFAARRVGFRGMMAIHPDQVPVINAAFTPSAADIERARRIVALFAATPGSGALSLDDEMVDVPHLKLARALLARIGEA
jgi:citrate lyase subunit beta/citryl-CoA lyase